MVEAAAQSGSITVELSDGKKYRAKLIGRDSSYDLAVLKIDVVGAPTLQLGDSEIVQVGDAVIAIGSPLGLSGTVTAGIISSKNRAVTTGNGSGESSFINALQTDAAINPGNSGGPLVDATGAVIGVNSAIATLGYTTQAGSIGLGFAIPINQAKKTAVDGIDLTVERGEIFALLGPNGAGKTTTVEILEGYRKASSGDVSVLGFDPATRGNAAQRWRNQIGIVLQSTSDAADLSVLETISHYANYYENPRDVEQVIDEVGLREKVNAKARELSGGQRRRLDVALGIIGSPELLFLDEPTTGFDPEARRSFWELIRVLKAEGTTILLTTHYLDEAQALADRVGVINNGKILEIATPQTLGGRNHAPAKVTWLENGVTNQINTQDPTAEVLKLSQRFNGQIPELEVLRPNLEEIYLKMIGEIR